MKYKLLKDIDDCNAGQVFNYPYPYTCSVTTVEITACVRLMNCISLQYGEWFEEIKEAKSVYNLEKFDTFYVINANYNIDSMVVKNGCLIEKRISMGNAFLTREEAEAELEKRKAMATIKMWSHDNDGGYEFIADIYNYYIQFNSHSKTLSINDNSIYRNPGVQYYSKNKVEIARKELEAEYKILFNIK